MPKPIRVVLRDTNLHQVRELDTRMFFFFLVPRLPRSGKNVWKMKFFPGQGKVREFCGWSGKFRKDLESQEKVRELKINGYGSLQKIYFFC